MNKCAVGIFWRFAQRLFYLTVIDCRLQVSKVTMGTTVHVSDMGTTVHVSDNGNNSPCKNPTATFLPI